MRYLLKGVRAWRKISREVDLMINCQVKPLAVRSWKAGVGGETASLGFWLRVWKAWLMYFRVVFSVL